MKDAIMSKKINKIILILVAIAAISASTPSFGMNNQGESKCEELSSEQLIKNYLQERYNEYHKILSNNENYSSKDGEQSPSATEAEDLLLIKRCFQKQLFRAYEFLSKKYPSDTAKLNYQKIHEYKQLIDSRAREKTPN